MHEYELEEESQDEILALLQKGYNNLGFRNDDLIEQFPERKLWKAVILKAIADAQIKNPNKYEVLHKEQAKNWLLHDNKDFVLICELAGLNPITTRNKVKSLLLK